MTQSATKTYPEIPPFPEEIGSEVSADVSPEISVERLRLLWESRRMLGRAALAGLAIGLLLAFLIPTRYDSTTELMPPDSQSSTGMAMLTTLMGKGSGSALGGMAGDLLGVKSSGELFIGVLHSRTVADRLVDRFNLQKVYGKRLREDARKKLAERTDISEDRKSGIISITVSDHDPARAAALAQAYVEELDRLVSQLSTSSAHRERVFLEGRLKEVNQDLETAEKAFSQFSSKNTAIDIKEQGKAMVEAAAVLQGQLIAAESELQGLKQIYTGGNARVKSTEAQVAELKDQLAKIGGSDPSATAPDENGSLYPSIRKLPLLGVTYADLYRRTKVDEAIFEALTQQYEMAKVEEAKDTPSVKVLDPARIPEKKSFPPRLLVIFLCIAFAVAGACVLVVINANWRETDASSPGKALAEEIFHTVNARMPWASPNGSRFHQLTHHYWLRLARHSDAAAEVKSASKS